MGQRRKELTPERSAQDRWGWELRTRRDKAGLSLAGLGALARYDPSYLARLERGQAFPSEDVARACDTALNCGGELTRLREEADAERRQAAAREAEVLNFSAWLLAQVCAMVRGGCQVTVAGRETGTVIVFDSRSLEFPCEDGGRR